MTAGPQSRHDLPRMPWCCPRCRGHFDPAPDAVRCAACLSAYPLVGGIPDLRVDAPSWVDAERDRERARALLALGPEVPSGDLAFEVFSRRPGTSAGEARQRTAQAMSLAARTGRDLDGWLRAAVGGPLPMLDLGCGAGGLLAAATSRGCPALGIDVSLEWLVVASRLVAEHGGRVPLAAAMAEALPLRDASLGGVVSLDVIEHVGDQGRYLHEIDRVLAPDGIVALATPNRFSLAAEPHVGVWGVGWLPRRWQARYVRWRAGRSYDYCRLLSVGELRRLFRRHTSMRPDVTVGTIAPEEIDAFPARRATLARIYNRLASTPGLGAALLAVCPFFRVVARKPGAGLSG